MEKQQNDQLIHPMLHLSSLKKQSVANELFKVVNKPRFKLKFRAETRKCVQYFYFTQHTTLFMGSFVLLSLCMSRSKLSYVTFIKK